MVNATSSLSQNESGTALVVALILVLISTVMGASAMQTSIMENKLADNEQYRQVAFRAAEAASEQLLTMSNLVTLANDTSSSVQSTDSVDTNVAVNAEFRALGDSPAIGYSLGGQNGFISMKFVSRANAKINAVDTASEVFQGVQRLTLSLER